MQIFWNEIKKIITWKILLLLVLVNSILFFLLIEFEITYFPNGRPALDSYHIGIEMIEKYGTHMNAEEFTDFKQIYESEVAQANEYLQSRQEFVEAEMGTYEKFNTYDWDNQAQNDLHGKVMFDDKVDLFWELQERERLIQFYEAKENIMETYRNDSNSQQQARYDMLIEKGLYQVYPEVAIDNFKRFIAPVAIAIILSVILVVSPVFIKDRATQLIGLQYTTKTGRKVYKIKAVAGIFSAFLVMTSLFIIYFGIYSLNKTSMYFDVPIHMFIGEFSWYNPTFFQYIILSILAIYALGFVFALLAMSFSSWVPNYITLIGIQIPFIVAMISYGLNKMLTGMISIWIPKWFVPTAYGTLIGVALIFILFLWKREKKLDIVH